MWLSKYLNYYSFEVAKTKTFFLHLLIITTHHRFIWCWLFNSSLRCFRNYLPKVKQAVFSPFLIFLIYIFYRKGSLNRCITLISTNWWRCCQCIYFMIHLMSIFPHNIHNIHVETIAVCPYQTFNSWFFQKVEVW